ncbi:hypothetical protein PIB30_085809 [Stylosanthes scabra]|uniref:Uncharacterized protein n=1 Tax=Stylosanthes scabra TaxID=79078 RepID=A0ABU6YTI2_9FABA|nr:hypothetical protein [Stylosanthes scabra]
MLRRGSGRLYFELQGELEACWATPRRGLGPEGGLGRLGVGGSSRPGDDEYDEYFADYFELAPPPSPDNSDESLPPTDDQRPYFSLFAQRTVQFSSVHTTILIGEMKGKSRKAGIGWEPRSFLTRYTRVNECKHDRVRFLFLDSMTYDLLCCAKFGAEVAKESARNEKIAKKSLKVKSRAYAYTPKKPMRTHCHDLGVTS